MSKFFTRARAWVLVVSCACAPLAVAQTVETYAGGRIIDNMPAIEAPVIPTNVTGTPSGEVFVINTWTGRLMRRDPATAMLSIVSVGTAPSPILNTANAVFSGPGGALYVVNGSRIYQVNLAANQYTLRIDTNPSGMGTPTCGIGYYAEHYAVATDGTLYYTDSSHHSICKVPAGSQVATRIAGTGSASFSGDGGLASLATLNYPAGLGIDAANNLYISDYNNNRIRKITAATGIITTIAGNGNTTPQSGENATATLTTVYNPSHLSMDIDGTILFFESGRIRVRRLKADGKIVTYAGTGFYGSSSPDGSTALGTSLGYLNDMAVEPSGDFVFSDTSERVRRVSRATNIVTSIIGNGQTYFCGEVSTRREACLLTPRGVLPDPNGDLYIADSGNKRIRRVAASDGMLSTYAGKFGTPGIYQGDGGPALNASFADQPAQMTFDATGHLYIAGGYGERIYRIDRFTNVITVVGGSGSRGFAGDGSIATASNVQTNYVASVAMDAAGTIYFADKNNHRIRRIAAGTGVLSTIAGNGLSTGALGDGGPATAASLAYPSKIALDAAGNLLIADSQHARIRKVDRNTGIITTILGNGSFSASGDGGPATAAGTNGASTFALDAAGNIFIIDAPAKVRRVDMATGIINIAGAPLPNQTPEGFWVTGPLDMNFDPTGRLYLATTDAILRIEGVPVGAADTTPPIITSQVNGTPGNNGWYRGNVQVMWSVVDAESGILTTNGCGNSNVTTDTAGITFTCTATSGGGTTSSSVTIKRDTAAPTLSFGAPSPAPDASGWNTGDVSIPFTTSDALSGVFSTSSTSPLVITGEGTNLGAQVTVTDGAGNSTNYFSPAVKIDRSAPAISVAVSGTAGSEGWYRSNVQVTWTVTETSSPLTTSGCAPSSVTTDTAGLTLTCTATSPGGTSSQSVTIKRDTVAPTLTFGMPAAAPDDAGWYAAPVSLPFVAGDALSGVKSTSEPTPLSIAQGGTAVSVPVVVEDFAGNVATFNSPALKIDNTPPNVQYFAYGSGGGQDASGWFNSDVRLVISGWDPDNSLVTRTGDCDVTLTTDTPGTTYTCTITSAGGSVTKSVTLKRDTTPPTVTWGTPSPGPNTIGWYTEDVAFPFEAVDATSGIAGTSQGNFNPVLVRGTGRGQTGQIYIWDEAGNRGTYVTPPVDIDRAPPAVGPMVTGTPGPHGWWVSDVQVQWVIHKIPADSVLSQTACEGGSVTQDTAGVTFECSATSGAGTSSSSVTIRRDTTAPAIAFGTPSPAPNANGWNKQNVLIPFTVTETMSGIDTWSHNSPMLIGAEGAGVSEQVTYTDMAGNTTTVTSPPRNIDKTPPVVTVTSPASGATYGYYQNVVANYSCADVSPTTCTGPVASGELVNTKSGGSKTFKVTGKDSVAFTTAVTNAFTVESSFNWAGFSAPANLPTVNRVARNTRVPIRWQLADGRGGFITNTAAYKSVSTSNWSCGSTSSVPYTETTSAAAGISFDAATSTFVYNWNTGSSATCRSVTIELRDGTLHELDFKVQ